MYWNFLFIF